MGHLLWRASIHKPHAGVSKAHPHPCILCPMPSHLFRLHGCMAAGMLSEPPAGRRGHCKATHCSCLF